MSAKKPRADSKLKSLPPAQQEAIFELLRQKSYAKAIPLIKEKFQVETSAGALSQFFAWFPLSRRLEQGAKFADELKGMLASNPKLTLRAEELSMIGQVAFEAQALQEQDSELYIGLKKIRLKERELGFTDRKIKLLEAKAEAMDKAAGIVGDTALTPEEKEQRIKAVFGIS